jgi:hypothetical protein
MARMSEMAPGGQLHCGSPSHPAHLSRDTMFFLEQKEGFFCFGCRVCTEVNRRPQLHVIAKSHGALKIFKNTRKAAHIDRDNQGHIVSFR